MPPASEKAREKSGSKSDRPSTIAPDFQVIRVDTSDFALAFKPAARKHYVSIMRQVAKGNTSFSELYLADFLDRQAVILGGLPAKTAQVIARDMAVSNELVYTAIGAPRATVTRQLRDDKPLSPSASERAVFLAELVKIVEHMIPEDKAKEAEFDAAQWVGRWLETQQPALGGAAPVQYLATGDGRAVVRRLLNSTFSGAYA